ncbi:MAG: serine hydrolase domain-containing protein [Polyangiaceae bacterium]|nr:serine hydrolase domain-containing protein [Polyangiaceae bacterium]
MPRVPIQTQFQKFLDSGVSPSLSVRATRGDQVIVDFLGGHSGPKGTGSPILPTTRFNVGSVTKPITGSLIVKLAEMGELSLDDSVARYIPEYPLPQVTLLNLLTHTAEFAEVPSISWPRDNTDLPRYFGQIYGISELKCPIGTTGTYFSQGYSILMDLLQRITGSSLESFARSALFEPLGMHHTTYQVDTLRPHEFVLPFNGAEQRHLEELRSAPPTGDSGLFSTAVDLVLFGKMLLGGGFANTQQVLSKASVALMLREVTGGKFQRTPGFWRKGPTNMHRCFGDLCSEAAVGHPGFSGCMLLVDPLENVAGAIVSNGTELHADWGNYRRIWNLVLGA